MMQKRCHTTYIKQTVPELELYQTHDNLDDNCDTQLN
jgi:hypothetical protein